VADSGRLPTSGAIGISTEDDALVETRADGSPTSGNLELGTPGIDVGRLLGVTVSVDDRVGSLRLARRCTAGGSASGKSLAGSVDEVALN
jgi:hypothetical protein